MKNSHVPRIAGTWLLTIFARRCWVERVPAVFRRKDGLVLDHFGICIRTEFHPAPPDAGRSCGSHRIKDGPRHERCDRGPGDL